MKVIHVVSGPLGPIGDVGPIGPSGSQGIAGPSGSQGPQGIQGETGPQGPQGIQGETGPQGPQGIQGPEGPQGLQGNDGLIGLQGPEGPQGPQGPIGDVGPIGPQGAQGTQGEIGPQGVQGIEGPIGLGFTLIDPNNLKVTSSLQLTGSLQVTNGITGSLLGSSSYSLTASYALNAANATIDTTALVTTSSFTAYTGSIDQRLNTISNATSSYVRKVNGNEPDPVTGNIAVSLAAVLTGPSSSLVSYPTGGLAEGTVWIVSNDTADKNGDSYIYDSGSVGVWYPIAPLDQTAADIRYARISTTAIQQLTASFATTASFVSGNVFNSANPALTSSYAVTSSYVVSSSFAITASYINPVFISASAASYGFGTGGGVGTITQIQGGSGINITNGTGPIVTVTATGGGGSGNGFPYDGRTIPARISGSLIVSGSGVQVTGSLSVSDKDIFVAGNIAVGAGGNLVVPNVTNMRIGDRALDNVVPNQSTARGVYNIAIGQRALQANASGSKNIAIGVLALNQLGSGSIGANAVINDAQNNVAIGYNSSYNLTSGSGNTSIGAESLYWGTTTAQNVAIGYQALYYFQTASSPGATILGATVNDLRSKNLAVGFQALRGDTLWPELGTVGSANVALGTQTLYVNKTGRNNVAIGNTAMASNRIGIGNTAIGSNALYYNAGNNYAVAIGNAAMENHNRYFIGAGGGGHASASAWGGQSIGIGNSALANAEGTSLSVGLGYEALRYDVKSNSNVAIGYQTMGNLRFYTEFTGSIGSASFGGTPMSCSYVFTDAEGARHPVLNYTVSTSYQNPIDALRPTPTVTRFYNRMIITLNDATPLQPGASLLYTIRESTDYGASDYNTAVGTYAMKSFPGGPLANKASGRGNGYNVAIGYNALGGLDRDITSIPVQYKTGSLGQYNVGIGVNALAYIYRGVGNIALGGNALPGSITQPFIGNSNNASGNGSLFRLVSGNENVANGALSLYYMREGSNNLALGVYAGYAQFSSSYNVIIGHNAMYGNSTWTPSGSAYNVIIGNQAGYNTAGSASYNVMIGPDVGYNVLNQYSNRLFIGKGRSNPENFTYAGVSSPGKLATTLPLIGGRFDEQFAYIGGYLGLGQPTASYQLHALSTTTNDSTMYFDGGNYANANLVVAADTSNAANTGNTGKVPGIALFDRNSGLIENNITSNRAYIALNRHSSIFTAMANGSSRNQLIIANLYEGKGQYFINRINGVNTVAMIITGSTTVFSGSIQALSPVHITSSFNTLGTSSFNGPTTFRGNTVFSGSLLISGSLIPNVIGGAPGSPGLTSSFNLGSPTAAWRAIYVATGSIHFMNVDGDEVSSISVQPGGAIKVPSLYTEGNITVNTIISQSTTYIVEQYHATGSNIFGSSSLDTHQFTGSVFLSNATYVPGLTPSIGTGIITIDNSTGRLYYTSSNALGVAGATGSSAYEIWLANGNVGSQTDFLTSLIGATGATGPYGPTGPQGEVGPQGVQGPTGPQGEQGVQGPPGIEGPIGETGPQGPQGVQGETGPQGIQGETGPQGPSGSQGPQGDAGPAGANGLGFIFIDSLILGTTASIQITGSLDVTNGITGSLLGTATTASYIDPLYISSSAASYGFGTGGGSSTDITDLNTFTGSIQTQVNNLSASTSSYVVNSVTSSMLAPYVVNSVTASMLTPYVLTSSTGSMRVLSSSFAATASFVRTAQTASFSTTLGASLYNDSIGRLQLRNSSGTSLTSLMLTASLALTASIVSQTQGSGLHRVALLGNLANNQPTSIYYDHNGITYDADINQLTVSGPISAYSITASLEGTGSWAIQAQTASYYGGSVTSASFASTAAAVSTLNQNVTIVGNLSVFGTASYSYVSASQLNVGTNTISVNVGEPAQRFGGLVVYDSGSLSHQATASLLWDSLNNKWIYQNSSGSTYSGGMLISGPRNTGNIGDEQGTTSNALMKGQGGDHITSSRIFDDGTNVYTNSNVQITGSLIVTDSIKANTITGSISGHIITSSINTQGYLLYDNTGQATVQWSNGYLIHNNVNSVEWKNRVLYDSTGINASIQWESRLLNDNGSQYSVDWNTRALYDNTGATAVSWYERSLYDSSTQVSHDWNTRVLTTPNGTQAFSYSSDLISQATTYHRHSFRVDVQGEDLSRTLLEWTGQGMRAQIDGGSLVGEIVYLETDGIWYSVNQSSDSATKMLGINIDGSYVLLEGDIVLDNIQSPGYGKPVYIRQGTSNLSTVIPNGGYIRVLGHCYWENQVATGQWILKFRPSNDWYEI